MRTPRGAWPWKNRRTGTKPRCAVRMSHRIRSGGIPSGVLNVCRTRPGRVWNRGARRRLPWSRCWNPTSMHLNMGACRIGGSGRSDAVVSLTVSNAAGYGAPSADPHPQEPHPYESIRTSIWTSHEAHVSAQPDSPPPDPWISGADEDTGRSQCLEAPPRQGAAPPRGHDRQQVSPGGDQRLRRSGRLRDRRDFQRVSRDGKRTNTAAFVVLAAPSRQATPETSLGVTASRRVGSAVVRNRVKRRIREWFRCHRSDLPAGRDIVVIARQEAATLDSEATWHQLHTAAARLRSSLDATGKT